MLALRSLSGLADFNSAQTGNVAGTDGQKWSPVDCALAMSKQGPLAEGAHAAAAVLTPVPARRQVCPPGR